MTKSEKRIDGRGVEELRPITAKVGVLKKAIGSAYFKLGSTSAIAGVFGPRVVHPKHAEEAEKAILRTKYNMAPFSTTTRNRPGHSRRGIEISMVTRESLSSAIFLEEFPKTAIDVHIEILQADASTRCVGINAAALALADAGVPMRDIVVSCSAGKVDGKIVLDVAGKEDTEGDLDCAIAYYLKRKELTLLQMDGLATTDEIKEIIKLAVKGCEDLHKKSIEALKQKYSQETFSKSGKKEGE
ncbi:exosome complex exonuclease Rrp41 [Candidatus Aenigmatarchaeota archaeon]